MWRCGGSGDGCGMSISSRIKKIALAVGFAVAALVGPMVQPALASGPAANSADVDADAALSTCWYEYDIYLVNNTVYAYAFRDCVNYEVPQRLSVAIQVYVGDEWGSMWVDWVRGYGSVSTQCPGHGVLVRHSITKETLTCP
jgi:hypothetical protein